MPRSNSYVYIISISTFGMMITSMGGVELHLFTMSCDCDVDALPGKPHRQEV